MRSSEKKESEKYKPQTCPFYKDLVNSLAIQCKSKCAGRSPSTEEEVGDRGQWDQHWQLEGTSPASGNSYSLWQSSGLGKTGLKWGP